MSFEYPWTFFAKFLLFLKFKDNFEVGFKKNSGKTAVYLHFSVYIENYLKQVHTCQDITTRFFLTHYDTLLLHLFSPQP